MCHVHPLSTTNDTPFRPVLRACALARRLGRLASNAWALAAGPGATAERSSEGARQRDSRAGIRSEGIGGARDARVHRNRARAAFSGSIAHERSEITTSFIA
eukprot:3093026-Pleurochrysis_carterae.AAC.1